MIINIKNKKKKKISIQPRHIHDSTRNMNSHTRSIYIREVALEERHECQRLLISSTRAQNKSPT
jgi:hypothetical protein